MVETMCPLHNVEESRVSCVNEAKLWYGQNKEAPKDKKIIENFRDWAEQQGFLCHRELRKCFEKNNELEKRVKEVIENT